MTHAAHAAEMLEQMKRHMRDVFMAGAGSL